MGLGARVAEVAQLRVPLWVAVAVLLASFAADRIIRTCPQCACPMLACASVSASCPETPSCPECNCPACTCPDKPCPKTLIQQHGAPLDPASRVEGLPKTCVKPAFELLGFPSDFYYVKRVPSPSICLVQGMVIDFLDTDLYMKRSWSLRRQDRNEFLLPYLRATQDIRMITRKRRVFLDLGAGHFNESLSWFIRWYPLEFSEYHVFEGRPGVFQLPEKVPPEILPPVGGLYEQLDTAARAREDFTNRTDFPHPILDRIHVHEKHASYKDDPLFNIVDITRFIKEELKLTAEDAVVVKMDIGWDPWHILPAWYKDPEMLEIVDEIFADIHIDEPQTTAFRWGKGPIKYHATQLMEDMRSKGFFIHPWVGELQVFPDL